MRLPDGYNKAITLLLIYFTNYFEVRCWSLDARGLVATFMQTIFIYRTILTKEFKNFVYFKLYSVSIQTFECVSL